MRRASNSLVSSLKSGRLERGAVKTATYGIMHFCVAVAVAFAVTRNWAAALGVGLLEPLVQTGFYALHERLWSRRGGGPTGAAA